jgi:hypothetical protein
MANEFIARKGIISLDGAQVTGSLSVTGNISASIFTGSFVGDGSQLSGIEGFPFTGSAGITGSLTVVGPVNATTFTGDGSQLTGIEGFPFTGSARITGSLTVVGPVNATSFTGSLQGTATSASYIQLANVDGFTAYSASVNTAIDSVLDATTPLTATVNTGSSPLTLTTQSIVIADSTDGNLTINLPDLNTIVGTPNQKPIVVYKNDYSQNVIYVNPSGSQLVNGASQDIIVSIQLAVIYNPTSAGWVTEGTSAQSLAELELFFLPLTQTGSLATTGSNTFIGNQIVTGSLTVTGGINAAITGSATSASYVEYANVANKPALVSSSAQIVGYNIFATTGSNQFNGSQAITGSLTVTGQVVAQTLNVQQVTSSIVYSSGSNIFGNSLGNTQQFTGSLQVTGSTHYLLGSVGIGTTVPSGKLHLSSTGDTYLVMTGGASPKTFSFLVDATNLRLFSGVGDTTLLTIDSTGTSTFTGTSASPVLTLSNSTGGTKADFTITENTGLIVNSYEGASARSIDFRVANASALLISSTGAATFSESLAITKATSIFQLGNSTNNSYGAVQFLGNATGNGNTLGELDFFNKVTGVNTVSAQIEVIHEGTSGDNKSAMYFKTHNGTSLITPLTISSTGAAAFSSSVTAASLNVAGSGYFPAKLITLGGAEFSRYNTNIGTTIVDGSQIALSFGTRSNNIDYDNTLNILNGKVGIGTASPDAPLHILKSSATTNTYVEALHLEGKTTGTVADGFGPSIGFWGSMTGQNNVELAQIAALNTGVAGANGTLVFYTRPNATIVERMRITSGGWSKTSNDGTYVGASSTFHEIKSSLSNNNVAYFSNTSASPYGPVIYFQNAAPNDSTRYFLACTDSVGDKFVVRSNGGLANYQANDVNLSDERTKKDIEPLESYWDKFKAIEIVKFKYKDQTHDDYNIGVIAQQVEAVAPEFVDVDGWGETINEEEPLKSIYTADLHHATIKVLQECMSKIEEQQSQIESLKAEIQTLKQ